MREARDSEDIYSEQVAQFKLLDAKRATELGVSILKGGETADCARAEFIQANLRLVIKIARHYVYSGIQLADLIQEGNLGLMHALKKFSHNNGIKFSTYAFYWIHQRISNYVRQNRQIIVIPQYQERLLAQLKILEREYRNKYAYEPSSEEMAQAMGINLNDINLLKESTSMAVSLDAPIGEQSDDTLAERISNGEESQEMKIIREQMRELLLTLMAKTLNDREVKILKAKYGIDTDEKPQSYEAIGNIIGITRERVRQVAIRAMKKLHKALRWQGISLEDL